MTPAPSRSLVAFTIVFAAASLWAALKRSDEEAIRVLISRYAAALDAADPALASQIWSHAPEVSFIHPLGEEHGLEQIEQDVYTHLMGETFSERHLEPHDLAVHVYGNAAWAEFLWDFHAKLRKDGSPVTTHGRETQIYRKEKAGWRIVHVHYSAAP
jgi:ketosteroid isomerase-like protein